VKGHPEARRLLYALGGPWARDSPSQAEVQESWLIRHKGGPGRPFDNDSHRFFLTRTFSYLAIDGPDYAFDDDPKLFWRSPQKKVHGPSVAFTSTTTSTNLHLPILWLFVGDYGAFQIELTYAWNYLIDLGKTECQSLEATVVGPEGGVFVESRDGQRVNAAQRHPFIAESPIEVRDQAAGRADLDHVNSWQPAAVG